MSNKKTNNKILNVVSAESSKDKIATKETLKIIDNSLEINNNNNLETINENIDNNNKKIKIVKHVCFLENFVEEIEVECWKKFNEDVSTYAPYPWELEEKKEEKICCNCMIF
jgi:hypothetical protein